MGHQRLGMIPTSRKWADVVAELTGGPTDVSEMAQQAAGEAVAELVAPRAANLFGSGQAELQEAVRTLSTKVGFSDLGQRFFGHFTSHFLNFYLSRVTAGQVGGVIP